MNYAITGYGTRIRDGIWGKIKYPIPKGGAFGELIHDHGEWSEYNFGFVHNGFHKRIEVRPITLHVPYVSQLEAADIPGNQNAADDFGGDCGLAAVAMIAKSVVLNFSKTVDELARGVLSKSNPVAHIRDLLNVTEDLGIKRHHSTSLDLHKTIEYLHQGKPIIQLVDYERIPFRINPYTKPYVGGHYVVVYGVTLTGVLIHDPYQWFGRQKDFDLIPFEKWIEAISVSAYNFASQGIIIDEVAVG